MNRRAQLDTTYTAPVRLRVATGGNLRADLPGGRTEVLFTDLPGGVDIDVPLERIHSHGTTAAHLVMDAQRNVLQRGGFTIDA